VWSGRPARYCIRQKRHSHPRQKNLSSRGGLTSSDEGSHLSPHHPSLKGSSHKKAAGFPPQEITLSFRMAKRKKEFDLKGPRRCRGPFLDHSGGKSRSKMRINSIQVGHFRSIEMGSLVSCGGLNVLIGKNNAGKSNLLSAIEIFLRQLRRGVLRAFYPPGDPPTSSRIEIRRSHFGSPSSLNFLLT
jgi:hypothetical protein